MSAEELAELDKWVCVNVLGWQERQVFRGSEKLEGQTFWVCDGSTVGAPCFIAPTTNPAAAMMVLKRCMEEAIGLNIWKSGKEWVVQCGVPDAPYFVHEQSPTLELAICLFAKSLFSQPERKEG